MTWPRAFLPVPTQSLFVDSDVAQASGKASQADMKRWMGYVPRIYEMLARGISDADFHRMVQAPRNTQERHLGETYRHLFSTSASAQPLRADLTPDGRLTVQAGQHRVRTAQAAGVPVVPVHVSAPDEAALKALRSKVEPEAQALQPSSSKLHRAYDEHFQAERARTQELNQTEQAPTRTEHL
jgi:hypothetical protein